jgi:hypothetical protein
VKANARPSLVARKFALQIGLCSCNRRKSAQLPPGALYWKWRRRTEFRCPMDAVWAYADPALHGC